MPNRRSFVLGGGAICAALGLPLFTRVAVAHGAAGHADTVEVTMAGRPDGSHVWFDPLGVLLQPGQSVRWINRDAGNSHTATAYHPDIFGRSRRMPQAAAPWDSDYLLPDESFTVTFTEPGVYDYYCQPHEHAGMVGRIVVGEPPAGGWWQTDQLATDPDLPEAALAGFPPVAAILEQGLVRPG